MATVWDHLSVEELEEPLFVCRMLHRGTSR